MATAFVTVEGLTLLLGVPQQTAQRLVRDSRVSLADKTLVSGHQPERVLKRSRTLDYTNHVWYYQTMRRRHRGDRAVGVLALPGHVFFRRNDAERLP